MKRHPGEKITVRFYPGQIDYLLGLLEKQAVTNADLIADRLRRAAEQHATKEIKWEQENK